MARYNYQVVSVTASLLLGNVQTVVVNRGRQQIQDPFRSGTAIITGRKPEDLPSINIGDLISVRIVTDNLLYSELIFYGKVSDFRVTYGEVTNLDKWTIYAEDAMAEAGRALTTASGGFANGDLTWQAAEKIATDAGVPLSLFPSSVSGSTVSAQSLPNTNALNVLQQLIFTEQGRLYGSTSSHEIIWQDRNNIAQYDTAFTDGTVTLAPQYLPIKYNEIQFYSQADSYATRVVIEPEGLATQTSGAGDRVFTGKSYDQTTSQAANLGDYVRATLAVQNATPQTVSCISEVQVNDEMCQLFRAAGSLATALVVLRGVIYRVFVEGAVLTGSPEQTRISFDLVSSEALNFFILDNDSFGVLDTNKLGF